MISQINPNLCSIKRLKSQNLLNQQVLNMTSTPYLIPRQREISKTKWQPLYTLKKQHQQNRLCVDLNTLSLNFILLFLYIRYSIDRTITYYFFCTISFILVSYYYMLFQSVIYIALFFYVEHYLVATHNSLLEEIIYL